MVKGMYVIGEIVYGVDLNHPDFEEYFDLCYDLSNYRLLNDDGYVFATAYSGSAKTPPMWYGIHLANIDECDTVYIDTDIVPPTIEQINGYALSLTTIKERYCFNDPNADQNEIDEFDKMLEILKNHEPRFMIIWSTS
jgi:hypothetical protein